MNDPKRALEAIADFAERQFDINAPSCGKDPLLYIMDMVATELAGGPTLWDEYSVDQRNIGATIAAQMLKKIAETGKHDGVFGGADLEAAAQAIKRLYDALEKIRGMASIAGYDAGHSGILTVVEEVLGKQLTIPYLMNCSHSSDGWCLACVRELHDALEHIVGEHDRLSFDCRDKRWIDDVIDVGRKALGKK
jgi:hypothetical protein